MFQKDPSELRNGATAALKEVDAHSKFPTYEVLICNLIDILDKTPSTQLRCAL